MEAVTHAHREDYGTLLKKKLPHVIRTRKDYETYLADVRRLMTANRTKAETQYLNLLVTLIQAYERENVEIPAASPLDVLHELMEARGMAQADLARLVGSSGTASEIYNGKRAISVALAKKLGGHFGVSFALFL
jgi:HTH-type transcriptional regulator/antitoxin HigA